jgi:hypothetical protein
VQQSGGRGNVDAQVFDREQRLHGHPPRTLEAQRRSGCGAGTSLPSSVTH